jgi:hypothetical protein
MSVELHGFDSPYLVGPPVSSIEGFYGRREQIRTFFQNLNGQRMHSQRVLGARRSGKTSFLRHVANPKVSGPRISTPGLPVLMAYVNLQAGITEPLLFFGEVARAIAGAAASLSLDIPVPRDFAEVRDFDIWVEGVCRRFRIVALLDEFEVLAQSDRFDLDFFRKLRAMAGGQLELVWATASYRDVITLSKPPGTKDLASPLLNIFHPEPIYLGPLENDAAEMLVSKPAACQGTNFSQEEVREIRQLAGDMPFFLQAAADQWFVARAAGIPERDCRSTVLEHLLSPGNLVRELIAHFWASLSVRGQRLLRVFADGRSVPENGDNRDTLWTLEKYGFLSRQNDGPRLGGTLVQQWIRDHSSSARGVPYVFVGHGHSPLWLKVKNLLSEHLDLIPVCYESTPRAGQAIVPILKELIEKAEFAIVVVTGEDKSDQTALRPRQNIVHEVGLFQGSLGFEKVVLLVQEGVEFLSNLDGMQYIGFKGDDIDSTFWKLSTVLRRENLLV